MALTKYTKDTAVLENVGTKPEDRTDLTDVTFKRKWDENATDWKTFFNDTVSVELDALITAIKGAGWTTESLKGLADLISTHLADLITDTDGAHGLKIESGLFTPTVIGTTAAGVGTYTTQTGRYTKIGNMVQFNLYLAWTAHTGTGNIRISSLPFTSLNQIPNISSTSVLVSELSYTAGSFIGGVIPGNSNYIELKQVNGGVNSSIPMDTSVSVLVISGTYIAA